MAEHDPWIRVPVADMAAPKGGLHMIYVNRWWVVDKDGNLLFYKSMHSPQCNPNPSIVRAALLEPHMPGASVVQVPMVCVPVKPSDYA